MLNAMKYKQSLQQSIDNQSTRDIAMDMYINEEYKTCLDDYNHIISTHSDHLEDIHQQLKPCKLSECEMARRCNNNDRRGEIEQKSSNNNNIDGSFKTQFYSQLLDRIHFWLHHQFDVGMRIEKSIRNNGSNHDDFDDKKMQNANVDSIFARIKTEINHRRNKWKLKHSNSDQVEKYTLQVYKTEYGAKSGNMGHTFIDSILEQLQQEGIDGNITDSFRLFITLEEYDSDAIIADITQYENGSNIITSCKDHSFSDFMQDISYDINRMSLSPSMQHFI